MQFYRRQRQLLRNICIFDSLGLSCAFSDHHFGGQGGRGDGRAATESLEFCVNNFSIIVNLDHKFHNITTSRCANHSGADIDFALIKCTNVAWVVKMVVHSGVISEARNCYWTKRSKHSVRQSKSDSKMG